MAVFKIIFHKELNAIQCVYGYIGTSHECKEEIKGKIIFVRCSKTNCNVCKNEVDRKECNSLRWITNTDGYLVCGTCYEKLGCEPICENFFCRICYASVEEYCSCSE